MRTKRGAGPGNGDKLSVRRSLADTRRSTRPANTLQFGHTSTSGGINIGTQCALRLGGLRSQYFVQV